MITCLICFVNLILYLTCVVQTFEACKKLIGSEDLTFKPKVVICLFSILWPLVGIAVALYMLGEQ